MSRDLTPEEKLWCLEQTIAVVKEVGHGGHRIFEMQPQRCKVSIRRSMPYGR